jgi:hypothetical protein
MAASRFSSLDATVIGAEEIRKCLHRAGYRAALLRLHGRAVAQVVVALG